MSCATGLFTRRFALSEKYGRVLGCDYSPSMLTEARRRINADPKLSSSKQLQTSLDLVRLDVGRIPMQNETVDCLHAGAAMHCWPDLDAAASEIYRVLKPGGRYFATTFLSVYFATISALDGQSNTPPSQQAFQYFESVDTLRELLVRGGFEREKIIIEVLGAACVVIRAEK
jgi:ubiquinone/menaquinone biosynthesis C-methylase UbiE